MTPKNIQDVVAERVEELFQHYDDIDCAETVDQRITAKEEAELWLTTTLTQLVKEVEARVRAEYLPPDAYNYGDKSVIVLHQKTKEVDIVVGGKTFNFTLPTSDVIEK